MLVQVYYSPEVPRDYVEVKADLLGLLKEYEARSGGKIRLNLVPTELFSTEAREAEKRFGIEPRRVFSDEQGKQMSSEVFLGVAFTSGVEEVVIPFFDRGLPVEYELTRSIRVVSKSGRKKVGILTTDAKLMGGMDMRTFSQTPEWSIVTELKKQYDVSSVSPDTPISSDLNVLLVAQPSSLTQKQIDNLTDYIKKGGGDLALPRSVPGRQSRRCRPSCPRCRRAVRSAAANPRSPRATCVPCSISSGSTGRRPRSSGMSTIRTPSSPTCNRRPRSSSSARGAAPPTRSMPIKAQARALQEIVTLFPGMLRPKAGSGTEFIPLLRTGATGGTVPWSELVQQSFMGISGINPRRRHIPTGMTYTLAARLTGQPTADTKADKTKDADKKKDEKPAPAAKINVIAIADLDLIGEQFFEMRRRKVEDLEFDNVPFVLNCVDVLAGDESFVGLRRKRPLHRRLDVIEQQVKAFDKELAQKTKEAEDQASDELLQAQKSFDKEVDSVKNRTEWDERTKEIQLANLQSVAQRRLDVKKQVIEDKKLIEIREGKAESERKIRGIRNTVRLEAAADPAASSAHPGHCSSGSADAARKSGSEPASGWLRTTGPTDNRP